MSERGIIYIPSNGIWTERDHIRYGLDFFKKKKVYPLVITTSHQETNYDYLVQKDQKERINDFLKNKKNVNVIILGGCHFFKQLWLLKFLRKNHLPWALQVFNVIPETYNINQPILFQIKRIIKIFLNKIAIKLFNINYPKYIFSSSKKSELIQFLYFDYASLKVEIPDEGYSKVINSKKNGEKKIIDIAGNYHSPEELQEGIVFIDEGGTHHPDQYAVKNYEGFYDDEYYNEIRKSLEKLSNIFSKKIFIAAHPSSNYQIDKYGNIPVFKDLTLELIKNCSMTVIHKSTALNLSIIFNKPILFLSSNFSTKTYLKNQIKLAKIFRKVPLSYESLLRNYQLEDGIARKEDFIFYKDYLNKNTFDNQAYEIIYKNLWN
tara:strand:- start:143 stop:1273 length:1131 start_codon:yes stop_codon:yes gene_type:complete